MNRVFAASLVLVLSVLASAVCRGDEKHTTDPIEKVKENLQAKKAVLLDVREQSEWDAGYLKGASLLPSSKLKEGADLKELTKHLDKKQIIYTHCRGGGRALRCAEILKKEGFDVRALKLGYEDLLEAGFEKAAE